jgi:hypothetical protein
MNEQPPAELLRRLTPIPTYRDHPATTPHDVHGVDPAGEPVSLLILERAEPILLIFLSSNCQGCLDLWQGLDEVQRLVTPGLELAVVTRGGDAEDAAAIADLGRSEGGIPIVMSSAAFGHYAVAGPPFLVVVDGTRVRTEGVAWGIAETTRAALAALEG